MSRAVDFSRPVLTKMGFTGFESAVALRATRCASVPTEPGVYVVVRPSRDVPRFLTQSVGGHFKGRDPTVAVALLQPRWVLGAETVYIGKAERSTLRTRVRLLVDYGGGAAVGHQGGRYLWQLGESGELLVAWRADPHPTRSENELLMAFASTFGTYPYANIAGPRS